MLFNTVQFFIFFACVYSLYCLLSHRWQNRLLLVASYFFYACWDWRFLSLILISTVVDYFCGIKIAEADLAKDNKKYLFISIFTNLSILGFLKYCNFFTTSFSSLINTFGLNADPFLLNVILPVGISFYTFQTMSYTIDIYRKEIQPTHHFFDFALFVAFFPQLVAGPIERAKHLLPQILNERTLSLKMFYEGCFLIYWGLFLKVFFADNLAQYVDPVFTQSNGFSGIEVLFATYCFAFQIFCDFAGYSSIARGLGKCMGFNIMINFNIPYFSVNPQEFWKRWHISLSSWLRDYLYITLGGNRAGKSKQFRNLFVTMLLGGLWHGASWTFVAWGAYHGLLLIFYRMIHGIANKMHAHLTSAQHLFVLPTKTFFFFHFVCIGWLFFRCQSISQAFSMLSSLYNNFDFKNLAQYASDFQFPFICIGGLLVFQLLQYKSKNLLIIFEWPAFVRGSLYFLMYLLLVTYGVEGGKEFIYFQF